MKKVLLAIVVVGVLTALVLDQLSRKLIDDSDDTDDIYDVDKHSRGGFTGG
ncbi:MAG: hypothetical protein ACXWEY_10060 [Bacteroidia bacterium]